MTQKAIFYDLAAIMQRIVASFEWRTFLLESCATGKNYVLEIETNTFDGSAVVSLSL